MKINIKPSLNKFNPFKNANRKMHNFSEGTMCKVKAVTFAVIAILFSSVAHAQESEGLIQKAYKKFILKEKSVEKNTASKPERTDTGREAPKDAKTISYDGAYKDMSKTEIIQEIKDEVDLEEDILEQIPKLKRQKDKDGKDVYSYLIDGKQINLEDVDEKILSSLITQVAEKSGQIRSNAALEQQEQSQLRIIRSAGAVSRPPQAPSRPPPVPQRPPAPPRR